MTKADLNLFEFQSDQPTGELPPLAERMRPRTLDEFVGQQDVVGPGTLLRGAIANDRIFSMILWGPPGCGKTSLANVIAATTRSCFVQISAVLSGLSQIRDVIEKAKNQWLSCRRRTILFVDEIHRFNKSQQDAFLPHVESGRITLIGATTENPSFEVIPALLSRCRLITLGQLSPDDIRGVLCRALDDKERGLGTFQIGFSQDALEALVYMADGDMRVALNYLETIVMQWVSAVPGEKANTPKPPEVVVADIERLLRKKMLLYDKNGEEHFNLISAFHKSLRGSDPDAAIYWLARMLAGGEDPLYVARRMVRFATEDVGLADPQALGVALNAMEAYRFLGSPEGEDALVQAAVYLASAPKSNSIYLAYKAVKQEIGHTGALPVPYHIRNAPTPLMKSLGYGKDYKYAHDYEHGIVAQEYLPGKLRNNRFYHPVERGYETTVKRRLEAWRRIRARQRNGAVKPLNE